MGSLGENIAKQGSVMWVINCMMITFINQKIKNCVELLKIPNTACECLFKMAASSIIKNSQLRNFVFDFQQHLTDNGHDREVEI